MEEIASVKSEAKQHLDNLQNANTREMRAQAIITTKWQLEKTRKLLLNAPEGRRVVCQKEFVELNHECHKLNLFLERFNCGAINIPSPQHISDLRGIVNRCTDEIENCYKKDLLDWSTKTKQSRLTIDEIGRVMRRIAS